MKIYFHKSFQIWIFKISIYMLGKEKFSLRFECAYGWDR